MYKFDKIEAAIQDIKDGKMVVVVDDEDRENEGDLIIAAEKITPEALNFMVTNARGLVCMPASEDILSRLDICPMVENNTDNHETAFTVSIDHISTTTGISALERATTILKVLDENAKIEDFRRPGHIFPLIAKKNGVLERTGHTEAAVDLARLAGLKPAGVICEIMNADGTMARTPDLMEYCKKHLLKIITIKDLVEYITKSNYVENVVTATLPTEYGVFKISGYIDNRNGEHHIALYMGDIADGKPVLTRVHSECLTGDVLGSSKCDCGNQYKEAMRRIAKEGRGVLIYMRQEGRGIGLINKLKAYSLQENGLDTVDANIALGFPEDLRHYDVSAKVLLNLGVTSVNLMTNNPTKINELEQYGIKVNKRVPIEVEHSHIADFYMNTKKARMGHILKEAK